MTASPPVAAAALRHVLAKAKTTLAVAAAFSLFLNLLMLTAPIYMMQVFDRVLASRSGETLFFLTLIAVAALVTLGILDFLRGQALARLANWVEARLGPELLRQAIAAAVTRAREPSVQSLRDLSVVRQFLTGPGITPLFDAPWTPIFLVVIFLLHPWLGVLALCGAAALAALALLNEILTRGPAAEAGRHAMAALERAESVVRNAEVVSAMGMAGAAVRRWGSANGPALAHGDVAAAIGGGVTATSKAARLMLQVGVLGLGAYLVIGDTLSPGGMIAASILMARALAPVEMAIGSWRHAVAARSAYARIKTVLAQVPPATDAMALPRPTGRLAAEGVAFAYRPGAPILRGIDFALEPAESLALVGPSASGKTTLARLLVGLMVPQAGHVRLDGMDMAAWDAADRGRHVGYLPQDVELFAGTVRENIARLDEDTSDAAGADAVVAAARLAGVHDEILRLPAGYETEIGPAGAVLSGGQRQRIALARALYGSPRLVVLDEPNASLDPAGEAALKAAMARLKAEGATVVVIAHRPSVLQDVDRVIVLQDGRVQLNGAPAEVFPRIMPGTGHVPESGNRPAQGTGRAERA